MVDPAEVSTILDILMDYGVDDVLTPAQFNELVSKLEQRENVMVVDIGPRLWANSLDTNVSS